MSCGDDLSQWNMIHAWPPKGNMLTIHLRNIALLLLTAGFPWIWKSLENFSRKVWKCLDLSGFVWIFWWLRFFCLDLSGISTSVSSLKILLICLIDLVVLWHFKVQNSKIFFNHGEALEPEHEAYKSVSER